MNGLASKKAKPPQYFCRSCGPDVTREIPYVYSPSLSCLRHRTPYQAVANRTRQSLCLRIKHSGTSFACVSPRFAPLASPPARIRRSARGCLAPGGLRCSLFAGSKLYRTNRPEASPSLLRSRLCRELAPSVGLLASLRSLRVVSGFGSVPLRRCFKHFALPGISRAKCKKYAPHLFCASVASLRSPSLLYS